MPLLKRQISVTFTPPNGGQPITLDQTFNLRVSIHKMVLAMQNRAEIEVTNLDQSTRAYLLSNFTAWNKRMVNSGSNQPAFVACRITAGYSVGAAGTTSNSANNGAIPQTSQIFLGEVAQVDLVGIPPDITVRITAFTRQVDKTKFVTNPAPAETTLLGYAQWVAGQINLPLDFQSQYASTPVQNPATSMYQVGSLIWDLQDYRKPFIAAFVDDQVLYVRDKNKIVDAGNSPLITEFVGVPSWTEYGIQFRTFFNQSLKLANAVQLQSVMNPIVNGTSTGSDGQQTGSPAQYIITELQYDLCSRETPFYCSVRASPSAGTS